MSTRTKFQVFPDSSGEYRWRLRAADGKIVGQSEAYTRKEDAHRGATALANAAGQIEWEGPDGDQVMVEFVGD
jgi:uncharacterized protein YegP (UPF0339 family)